MFVLIVFIWLSNGQLDVRTSVTTSMKSCQTARPLVVALYEKGKFEDGPPKEDIRRVFGRCESVE